MTAKSEAREVIERVYAGWIARDLDATMAPLAEDIRYTLHPGPGDTLPFAGTVTGLDAVRERLALVLDHFAFDAYVVESMRVRGHSVRASIVFYYTHQASGEYLNGRFRHVWHVDKGAVISCDEYHDIAMLEAFFRLIDWQRRERDLDLSPEDA